jgi:uncharacterized protein (DUF58 family)
MGVSATGDPAALFGFDSAFLARLERLAVLNRQAAPGLSAGPRRSTRRGASVEFADFRDYAPGDDFRRIDWNAYARLERLFLRLYSAEEMTTLTLFLDRSVSMRFGDPSKALTAGRLAAVLAYIALHNYDRVALAAWSNTLDSYIPPRSGRVAIPRVWGDIAGVIDNLSGETDVAALARFGRYRRGRGLAVVLTDLLTESDWRAGLRGLRAAGQEVSVIQVLAREEIAPDVRGDWRLTDVEGGREVDITASPRLLRRYAEEFAAHTETIRLFCRREGIAYVQLPTDLPLADAVLSGLHAGGLVG